MLLSNKPITKALIRLCVCAGWSAPVLFANLRGQFFSCQGPSNDYLQFAKICHNIHRGYKQCVVRLYLCKFDGLCILVVSYSCTMYNIFTLVNVYVDLLVYTRIAGTS